MTDVLLKIFVKNSEACNIFENYSENKFNLPFTLPNLSYDIKVDM